MHTIEERFRPLTGIMILNIDDLVLGMTKLNEYMFPSPYGDYDS